LDLKFILILNTINLIRWWLYFNWDWNLYSTEKCEWYIRKNY